MSDKQTQLGKQKLIPVKFQEAGDANYFLFEGKDLIVNNGDLVILVNNRNALLAGVVRQQKDLPNFAMRRILIEKIHGELSAYSYRQNSDDAHSGKAIVLNEATDNAEIFVDDDSLKPFTSISLGQRPAKIANLREFTAEFSRFQLIFAD